MAFMESKKEGIYPAMPTNQLPFATFEPYANEADTPALAALARKDERYRRSIRILQFVSRVLSFILALILGLILAYTLASYYITKDRAMPPAHTPIWPMPTVVWPTYFLFVLAVITAFIDLIMLCVSCCCLDARLGGVFSHTMLSIKFAAWLVGMAIFAIMKRGDSIWGYACNTDLEAEVRTYMKFDRFCTVQSAAWGISVLEAAVALLTLCLYFFLAKKLSNRTRMGKTPKGAVNVEMGSPYKFGSDGPGRYAQLDEPSPYGREAEH
ncbi:hypothetical protein BP5796_11231 [Coleophoma crateriformis]|uniref:MARVEL domain-containing protein n=1 Tax=Coleophoma crateriformis TaxID=565419 RepID=A0A3D8QHT7_9HELO|nr:hypothetical protein BP5796_11231 [Coleophoma crateriformis]